MTKKKQQNPKKLAMMIGLIVVVWGAVFYQIFFPEGDKEPVSSGVMNTGAENDTAFEKAEYKLLKNYADPFLGEGGVVIKSKPKKKSIPKVKKKKEQDLTLKKFLEKLSYKGVINDRNTSTAYVVFKEKSYLLTIGDSLLSNQLITIENDSLEFKNSSKKFWVKK